MQIHNRAKHGRLTFILCHTGYAGDAFWNFRLDYIGHDPMRYLYDTMSPKLMRAIRDYMEGTGYPWALFDREGNLIESGGDCLRLLMNEALARKGK